MSDDFAFDVRRAWEQQDHAELLGLMRLRHGNQWRTAASTFFAVTNELKIPVREVFGLAEVVEGELRARHQFTYASLWRIFAVPRVLQLEQTASFDDAALVAYAAGAALPKEWLRTSQWIGRWAADVAAHYAGELRTGDLQTTDDLGLTRSPVEGGRPPLFHPLVLTGLRRALSKVENALAAEALAAALSDWLLDAAIDRPIATASIETLFAASATVLGIAEFYGGLNGPTPEEAGGSAEAGNPWSERATRVINRVANLSEGARLRVEDTESPPLAQIVAILGRGPRWHTSPVVDHLRRAAMARLSQARGDAVKAIGLLDASLSAATFAPALEAVGKGGLADRRAAVSATKPTYLDPAFSGILNGMQQAEAVTFAQTEALRPLVKAASAAFADLTNALASPLVRASLLEPERPTIAQPPAQTRTRRGGAKAKPAAAPLDAGTLPSQRLADAAIQQRAIAHLPLASSLYPDAGLWPEQEIWRASVTAVVPRVNTQVDLDQVLHAWGKLDIWEGLRGSRMALEEADPADHELWAMLPAWLGNPELPPGKRTDAELTAALPVVAAVTLLGLSADGTVKLRSRLEELLGTDLSPALMSLLAAARLDLGITVATRSGPATAFVLLAGKSNDRQKLLHWIAMALAAPNAWATRVGMQALILLGRVAELTGDMELAAGTAQLIGDLASTPGESSALDVGAVCWRTVEWLLTGSTVRGSGLPLAFVAADLTRYARTRAMSIVAASLDAPLAWLPAAKDPASVIAKIVGRVVDRPRACLEPFVTDLPAKLLLLAVMRIHLDQLQRSRYLLARPLRREEVEPLWQLRGALRALFSGDALIQNNLPDAVQGLAPWWSTSYWSMQGLQTTNPEEGSPLLVVNWIDAAANEPSASLLREASALDISVPPLPPAKPASTGSTVIQFDDSWLWDIDGRYEGEFPEVSWRVARNQVDGARTLLVKAENTFTTALKNQAEQSWREDIAALLRQPLLLGTADFRQQIEAALAEVREAEAELDVAQHESLAADFEQHASDLIYAAARLELSRQQALEAISMLDQQVAAFEREIGVLEAQRSELGVDQAKIDQSIAGKRIQQAGLELEKASLGRERILEEIATLRQMLGAPLGADGNPIDPEGKYQIEVKLADGSTRMANGQIAAMAVQMEGTLATKLAEGLATARTNLEKEEAAERKRRKKSFWGKLVKGICKFVGTVVGAVLGGPAGAALGAALGEALGEIGAGMIEGKSLENILFGLIDNTFAIASAAGLNLEAELNKLGNKAVGELNTFFKTIDAKLAPVFDDLPRIFDEQVINDAFYVLGADEIPELAGLVKTTYNQLRKDLGKLEDRYGEAGGLGTILKGATRFESLEQVRKALTDTLIKDVFDETKQNLDQIAALGRAIGQDVIALGTYEGKQEAASRWAAVILSTMAEKAHENRNQIMTQWLTAMRDLGLTWSSDRVRAEAQKLLEDLYPNPETRAQVEANLRAALMDPETRRAMIQKYLMDWQRKFDDHLAKMQELPPGAEQANTALDVAKVEVAYLVSAQTRFQENLLPFLKNEAGHSPERDALFARLDQLQNELQMQDLTLKGLAIEQDIREEELTKAEIGVAQAEQLLAKARLRQQQNELGVEKASLLNQAATLARVSQETMTDAKEASGKAAVARAQAAKARITAARAALAARDAYLEAASRRGSEAARIRTFLAAPPPPVLDIAGTELAQARTDHARALAQAMWAYRELVRFYYSVNAPEDQIPALARPDHLTSSAEPTLTWGRTFEQWFTAVTTSFERGGFVTQKTPKPIQWELTPEQIAALTSPSGLRIVLGPQEEESPIVFTLNAAFAASLPAGADAGVLAPIWRNAFAENGISLPSETYARVDARVGGKPSRWHIYETQPSGNQVDVVTYADIDGSNTPVYSWMVERTEPLCFDVRIMAGSGDVTVRRIQRLGKSNRGRSTLPDRFIERVSADIARTGRVVGVFLTLYDRNTGLLLSDNEYAMSVEHLGDVWYSPRDVRLIRPRTSAQLGGRFHFIDDAADPLVYLMDHVNFAELDGDPQVLSIQGMPLSGTLVIRLHAEGESEFEQVKVRLLYKYYTITE